MPHTNQLGLEIPGLELAKVQPTITNKQRHNFYKKIIKTPNCWFYTGGISTPDGYGRVSIHINGKQKTFTAHRFAILLENIPIPPNAIIEHKCDEPLCVKVHPNHVTISTQQHNLQHAVTVGRNRGPQLTVNSKNRAQRSQALRHLLLTQGYNPHTYQQLKNHYDTPPTITTNQLSIWE